MGLDVFRQIQIQDNLTDLLRRTKHNGRSVGYCEPANEPLAEKLLTIEGDPIQVEVGDLHKTITPKINMILAGDEILFVEDNISAHELRRLLNPGQKSQMTRATNRSASNKVAKLNAQKT
jgi:hypothetical protein